MLYQVTINSKEEDVVGGVLPSWCSFLFVFLVAVCLRAPEAFLPARQTGADGFSLLPSICYHEHYFGQESFPVGTGYRQHDKSAVLRYRFRAEGELCCQL